MKLYKNILNILIILFIVLYPILPSYGIINSDLILYSILLVQTLGIIILNDERQNIIKNIPLLLKDKIFLSLSLLNLIMYASTIISIDKKITIVNSIRFSMYIFIYYSISYKLTGKNIFKILMNSFLSVSILSSFISIFQLIKYKFSNIQLNEEHRISSFLENSNNLGAYTILSIFIILLLLINTKKKSQKIFLFISSLLLFSNIILSQSRNALLALLFGSVLISIVYDKRFIIASVIIPVILFIIPQSRIRLLDIFNLDQNSSRFKIWKSAELMIKDNPIFGLGYENFTSAYPTYIYHNQELMVHGSYKALHPHNIFLKIQSELGILGSILFVLFLSFTIITLLSYIKNCNDTKIKNILVGITISFTSFQFMNLLDCYYNSLKVIITMFIILAIASYYNNINKNLS
ncbi:O-antigen ligase family protein [Clostridium sartagoforme]|uniref:O-antigen ligase family protein n=1 Tax=Clostridium sartagoforme TaxID=84031 RepID=UPI0031D20497